VWYLRADGKFGASAAMKRQRQTPVDLTAPFLRRLRLDSPAPGPDVFPFSIPAIAAAPFDLVFNRPVTIFVGANGSGKSTILEAIAALCGFGQFGGSRKFRPAWAEKDNREEKLSRHLDAEWTVRITYGFFTRSETFNAFIAQEDELAKASGTSDPYRSYGGKSLSTQSHGEAYLSVFENRLDDNGIYILDEPETALSPTHQIDFLRMLRRSERSERSQFIIATHSPVIMAYPGATLLHLTQHGVIERPFQMTDHFRILREFYADPTGFMDAVFCDEPPDRDGI
jgi:predicted ATPase